MTLNQTLARGFKTLLCTAFLATWSPTAQAATLIGAWTFETQSAKPNTPTTFAANFGTGTLSLDGTNGSSTWVQATELDMFVGTTLNDPRPSLAAGSAAATFDLGLLGGTAQAANGKSLTLKFSTLTLDKIQLSFATKGSGTGFTSDTLSYSTDGTNFTSFGSPYAPNTSVFATQTFDLSSITAINNQANVFLKLTFNGATGSSGNNHLDNIIVQSNPVPEPSTFVALLAGVGMLVGFRRLRGTHGPTRRNPSLASRQPGALR